MNNPKTKKTKSELSILDILEALITGVVKGLMIASGIIIIMSLFSGGGE